MKKTKVKVIKIHSENDLIAFVKDGFSSSYVGAHCTMPGKAVFGGEVLTEYSPGDLARANKATPENESLIARLVRVHVRLGATWTKKATSFLVLYDRGGPFLVRWGLTEEVSGTE